MLQFDDAATAKEEYNQAQGWIVGCPGGKDLARKGVSVTTVEIEDGQGEWRQHDFYAPDICTECDAIRFDRMGVAQFDDRVVLVSLAEVGGPLEPEGLDASMDELFQAAVTKAGGEITGAAGEGTGGPAPLDFQLEIGLPADGEESEVDRSRARTSKGSSCRRATAGLTPGRPTRRSADWRSRSPDRSSDCGGSWSPSSPQMRQWRSSTTCEPPSRSARR